jgi:hypothetical protein
MVSGLTIKEAQRASLILSDTGKNKYLEEIE